MAKNHKKSEDDEKKSKANEDAEETDEETEDDVESDDTEEEDEAEDDTDAEDDAEDKEDDSSSKEDTDYDAELERERRGKTAKDAFKEREQKRGTRQEDDEDEDDVDDDDKPLTRKDLRKVQAQARKEAMADRAKELADEMAGSDKEAELIFEIYQNRTFPEHLTMREQMEEAYAIANRRSLLAKNRELRRTLRSRDTAGKDVAGTHRDSAVGTAPKLAKADANAYARAGFKYDSKRKLWVKVLPNKKRLYKNPKTKAQWVE